MCNCGMCLIYRSVLSTEYKQRAANAAKLAKRKAQKARGEKNEIQI